MIGLRLRCVPALFAACSLVAGCGASKAETTSLGGGSVEGGGSSGGIGADGGGSFRHPGVLVNMDQLNFVKAKIASGAEPWSSGFAAALASSYASTTYAPQPVADVVGWSDSNPDVGCSAEMGTR